MKTLYGVRLWSVAIEYSYKLDAGRDTITSTAKLWITTARESLPMATKKATTFLKHNRSKYPKAKITAITAKGFIDA